MLSLNRMHKALQFTWHELKNRAASWIMLHITTMLIGSMLGGLLGFALVGILFSNKVVLQLLKDEIHIDATPLFDMYNSFLNTYIFIKPLLYIVLGLAIYGLAYLITSYSHVCSRNVLDVLENKQMRYLTNRVASHALVGGTLLFSAIIPLIGLLFIFIVTLYGIEFSSVLNLFHVYPSSVLALFCLPGFLLHIKFFFVSSILIDEQCDLKQAIKKSWHITQGHYFEMLAVSITLIALAKIPYVGFISFLLPFHAFFWTYLYYQYKQEYKNKLVT